MISSPSLEGKCTLHPNWIVGNGLDVDLSDNLPKRPGFVGQVAQRRYHGCPVYGGPPPWPEGSLIVPMSIYRQHDRTTASGRVLALSALWDVAEFRDTGSTSLWYREIVQHEAVMPVITFKRALDYWQQRGVITRSKKVGFDGVTIKAVDHGKFRQAFGENERILYVPKSWFSFRRFAETDRLWKLPEIILYALYRAVCTGHYRWFKDAKVFEGLSLRTGKQRPFTFMPEEVTELLGKTPATWLKAAKFLQDVVLVKSAGGSTMPDTLVNLYGSKWEISNDIAHAIYWMLNNYHEYQEIVAMAEEFGEEVPPRDEVHSPLHFPEDELRHGRKEKVIEGGKHLKHRRMKTRTQDRAKRDKGGGTTI